MAWGSVMKWGKSVCLLMEGSCGGKIKPALSPLFSLFSLVISTWLDCIFLNCKSSTPYMEVSVDGSSG